MVKIVYVQTVLTEEELEKLLQKAGTSNKKDALRKAILHYLKCQYDVEED
jgi:cell division ATPase FtsA